MTIEELIKSTISLSPAKKVLLNIEFCRNITNDRFIEILKPYGISSEQYNVLRILRGQKGKPVNMNIIQERMIAKNSNTTRLIDKLLLKELVTREICKKNRRKMEIEITQKGFSILSELELDVIAHEDYFANKLTKEEIEQLNILLEKYRN